MKYSNNAVVAELERVRGGGGRQFQLDNVCDLGGLVILIRVGILDTIENCLGRAGKDVLASLCLDTQRSTNHGCYGTVAHMTTTQHLISVNREYQT